MIACGDKPRALALGASINISPQARGRILENTPFYAHVCSSIGLPPTTGFGTRFCSLLKKPCHIPSSPSFAKPRFKELRKLSRPRCLIGQPSATFFGVSPCSATSTSARGRTTTTLRSYRESLNARSYRRHGRNDQTARMEARPDGSAGSLNLFFLH